MLGPQASVFASVNQDDPRVPCRTKPHKVWTSTPRVPGTGSSSADTTPPRPTTAPCLHPALRSCAGFPPPRAHLSLCFSLTGPGPRQVLWPRFSCLYMSACGRGPTGQVGRTRLPSCAPASLAQRSHSEPGTEPNRASTWAPGGLSNTVGECQWLTVGWRPPGTLLKHNTAKTFPARESGP